MQNKKHILKIVEWHIYKKHSTLLWVSILIFKDKATTKCLYLGEKRFTENCWKARVNILNTELAISLEIFFSNLATFILRQNDGSWGEKGKKEQEQKEQKH